MNHAGPRESAVRRGPFSRTEDPTCSGKSFPSTSSLLEWPPGLTTSMPWLSKMAASSKDTKPTITYQGVKPYDLMHHLMTHTHTHTHTHTRHRRMTNDVLTSKGCTQHAIKGQRANEAGGMRWDRREWSTARALTFVLTGCSQKCTGSAVPLSVSRQCSGAEVTAAEERTHTYRGGDE